MKITYLDYHLDTWYIGHLTFKTGSPELMEFLDYCGLKTEKRLVDYMKWVIPFGGGIDIHPDPGFFWDWQLKKELKEKGLAEYIQKVVLKPTKSKLVLEKGKLVKKKLEEIDDGK